MFSDTHLEQAVEAIREQSNKDGILIVLDAADNAQLEAESRSEDAFPKLLLSTLSSNPIEGVKLLLTARPHRMKSVIGDSSVETFELKAFSVDETKAFLESRRDSISSVEFATVVARSGGNARVLEYLIDSWEQNVARNAPSTKILVEEIIGQKCDSIIKSLHIAGWNDSEISKFFAAIALLPPPIPLSELAGALGWSESQVNSAASDLAPMLEVVVHGAIFRDEPTETYIRDIYSKESRAQQAIAQQLENNQKSSVYAAEALPRFLVIIKDSTRAFNLANSVEFPGGIQSEYGRRRLRLARLYAAFSLSVNELDFDRVLRLSMQLAQVASADAKGDQFIRRSPALATILGDRNASRRLFNDRSGWRGSRNSRLTVVYAFQGEMEEAEINKDRAVGWINWHYENNRDDDLLGHSEPQPDKSDFAAIIFFRILQGDYEKVCRNLDGLYFHFALSVCSAVITLSEQYEVYTGNKILNPLALFASSKKCTSFALQISLLSKPSPLTTVDLKKISRAISSLIQTKKGGGDINTDHPSGFEREQLTEGAISKAAFAALISNSRQSATRILSCKTSKRPSSYDYGERHGLSHIWQPVLYSCVHSWAEGNGVSYHHFLPHEIALTRKARAINSPKELLIFLENQEVLRPAHYGQKKGKSELVKQFKDSECKDIVTGIELIFKLIYPLEVAVLSKEPITDNHLSDFLEIWKTELRPEPRWHTEYARDSVCRNVGIGVAKLLMQHAQEVSLDCALKLLIIVRKHFSIGEALQILTLISYRPNLHELAGEFAQKFSEDIRKDEYIEQRSENYLDLAAVLVRVSIEEGREYYKQGLSQLDQMGGDDYDLIYSVLRYAAEQSGGVLKPKLGHRLMNLCQTIFQHEPSKFGWALFGRAAAKSIGYSAIYKLIRWDDQDVADYSNGLPQLACFLAKNGKLDSRRAAVILTLCEDHGWHDWKTGQGLGDILEAAKPIQRQAISSVVIEKLKTEHSFGGWKSLWESILDSTDKYSDIIDRTEKDKLCKLIIDNKRRNDEGNMRRNGNIYTVDHTREAIEEVEIEKVFLQVKKNCDITSAQSIDENFQEVEGNQKLHYTPRMRFFSELRKTCPYGQRSAFTFALCEVTVLDFESSLEQVIKNVELWGVSSAHITSATKEYIERIFAFKGSELFELSYSSILSPVKKLVDFCKDPEFVIRLVLGTITKEQLELNGEEWLDLATCLCPHATPETNLIALEELLSGSAAKIGDEIGEGIYQQAFDVGQNQSTLISQLIWHLLGDDDAFTRWSAARAIKSLADLELFDDIAAIFDCFDKNEVPCLHSKNEKLSFRNSQQWFLMGLARAALHHGTQLSFLTPRLEQLAQRSDIHVVHKLHIARCITHISEQDTPDSALQKLWDEIKHPPHGYMEKDRWPKQTEKKIDFSFDYEFTKHEISDLAWRFGISKNKASDAIATEIIKVRPEAKSMNDFLGNVKSRRGGTDHYESYREHIQKHALFSAATSLVRSYPVVPEYDGDEISPWDEWLLVNGQLK